MSTDGTGTSTVVFGIRVDGKSMSIGFPSTSEAKTVAYGFVSPGRNVEIYDLVTGSVVEQANVTIRAIMRRR
jgi:hypothetical protein